MLSAMMAAATSMVWQETALTGTTSHEFSEQIAALEKALAGWQAYRTYQERRLPGLRRRYTAARDYIRAAEDEQTGNI